MDTVASLERKLVRAKQHEPVEAKYPVDLIIDITGPEGNVFYLFKVANDLLKMLELPDEETTKFKQERDSQTTYQGHLDLIQKWFGIIFIRNEDEE